MNTPAIYLDYAAATPVDDAVAAVMEPYLATQYYNPSAIYLASKATRQALEDARHEVAKELGAQAGEIVFTAGASEANNLAISGIMRRYPDAKMLVSAVEHPSVLSTAQQYSAELLPVDEHGIVQIAHLQEVLTDDTVLISVMYANNEVGAVQPLREAAKLVAEARLARQEAGNRLPLYLHTDAAQAANYLDLQVSRLGVDLMTISAGKTYGPKQVGALFVKAGAQLDPIIVGGGQEFGLRSGTENVAGAVGFATALNIATKLRKPETERLRALQKHFIDQLQTKLSNIIIHGQIQQQLPNTLAFSLPGLDGETAVMMLDERGIQCATGSACGASKEGPSHVLLAMGVSPEVAERSLRLTMGRSTTEANLNYVLEQLINIYS